MLLDGLATWALVGLGLVLLLAGSIELAMAWQPESLAANDNRLATEGDPWTAAATVLVAAALIVAPVGTGLPRSLDTAVSAFGLVLALLGLLLRGWAIRSLAGLFSPHLEVRREHHLVVSGPYRLIRHPGYTGALLLFVGLALTLHRSLALAAVAVLAVAVFRRTTREELLLERSLPAAYAAYRTTAGRFLPRITGPLDRAALSTAEQERR